MDALLERERKRYHRSLLDNGVLTIDKNGIPSNADKSSKLSVSIAKGIAERLMAENHEKAVGQTSGAKFEQINMDFLNNTFPYLQNLRPGKWHIVKLGNRKGNVPHIVVVTGEPLPARLASLALGTGDIDCVYHFALYELIDAVKDTGAEDSIEMLNVLVEGKRLRDISDLPMDLAI